MAQTLKEGQLYKKGKINTEWRQRQFILNKRQLSYFKGGKHAPSGIIELKDVTNVTEVLSDGTFQITTPNRTYEIRGDSREQCESWITAINNARASQ